MMNEAGLRLPSHGYENKSADHRDSLLHRTRLNDKLINFQSRRRRRDRRDIVKSTLAAPAARGRPR